MYHDYHPDRRARADEFDLESLHASAETFRKALPRLFNYWFVEYNPLYFFSALLVLAGVFLVSRGVSRFGIEHGELLLTAVEEVYQFALIGAAALLYRVAGRRRPAAILGLLEALFLFDWTLRYSAMAPLSGYGLACGLAMAALAPLKIALLLKIFGLRLNPGVLGLPAACLAVVALAPHLLQYADDSQAGVHLLVTWTLAAVFSAFTLLKPKLESLSDVGPFGMLVLRRCQAAVWACVGVFGGVHLVSQMVQFNLQPTLSHGAPLLIAAALAAGLRREFWVWATAAAAVALALGWPATVAPTAAAVGIMLVAWAAARPVPRVYVAGALALWFAVLTIGWKGGQLPSPGIPLNVAATAVLAALFLLLRRPLAAAAGLCLWVPFADFLVPENELDFGILAISSGFLALLAAVGISWSRRGTTGLETGPALPGEPGESDP